MRTGAALDRAYGIEPVHERMLQVALLRDGHAGERWRALRREIDLDHFWDGKALDFLPLVYRALVDEGADDPDLPRLRGVHRRTWVDNQLRFRSLAAALRVLADAGVDSLVLKGGALALTVYPDVGLRPMFDFDVLVRPGQVPQALAAFAEAGWSPAGELPARYASRHQELDVVDVEQRVIDLHWHIAKWLVPEGEEWTADEPFWQRSVPLEVGGEATRALDATDSLLHAVLHGARNGWRAAPQWIPDATLIVAHGPIEWDRIVELSLARRLALPVRRGLAYLDRRFEVPVPADVLARLDVPTGRRSQRLFARAGLGAGPTPSETRVLGPFAPTYRFWITQSAPMGRRDAVAMFPGWLADHWGVDGPRALPAATFRRVADRVRRSGGAPRDGAAGLSTRPDP